MTRRSIAPPLAGSLDLTLWGPDERCLLISGPLPLLQEFLRAIQVAPSQPATGLDIAAKLAHGPGGPANRDGNAA